MVSVNCWGKIFISITISFLVTHGIKIEDDKAEMLNEIGCRFPGAPAHSSVVFSDETLGPGSVATYICDRGFELLGPPRRVCQPNGRWLPEGIPFCVINVAAGKAPMQISTDEGGIPQKAIDGSTSSFYTSDTCTLTRLERVPWWYVNLLEPYMVQLVRLDFGKSCCGSNKPATIVVRVGNNRPDLGTNPICNRFTGHIEEGQPLFLPCSPPMPGAFVSVHLELTTPTQLSICEAFVYTDQALPIERCPQFRDQPPGSTATYNGKCYIFYNRQQLKFREALAFCRSRGGTLVDESNPALQGFISWELWRRHRSDTSSQYWMGAIRDPQERNNWKWINGEDVTVSFWNTPGGNDDCARYDGSKGWLWSDTNCNLNLNFICQHQPKACGRPEQPPNSTMIAQNFNVGSTIEYSCDEGHLLVGPTTRTCLDTGFYNEFPPVCKRIQCGYPAEITFGQYHLTNDSVGYLSHVVYTCDEGYEMIGRAQLICDIDERWNGPPPRCEPVQCEPPISIANGRYTATNNETIFGTIIEYFCQRGYKLVGSKQIICQANGQYDSLPPHCKEDQNTIPPLIPSSTSRRPSRPTSPSTTRQRPKPTRPSIITTLPTQKPLPPTPEEKNTHIPPFVDSHPGRVREDKNPYRRRPIITSTSNSGTEKTIPPHIIVAQHPQENEIPNTISGRQDESANVNVPLSIDDISDRIDRRGETYVARLNLGAIIALGAFGGFVFLAAIITTVVILIRRNQSAKHYRHRASPDCNTVASFDSSSSESRNGLNRYYRQAWENLHESAGSKAGLKATSGGGLSNHTQLRRKDTLDEPSFTRERHRDGSAELVVADVASPINGGKKRHHHHHHHHGDSSRSGINAGHKDWGVPRNAGLHHRGEHNHSRKY